jgi:hypothetical protein
MTNSLSNSSLSLLWAQRPPFLCYPWYHEPTSWLAKPSYTPLFKTPPWSFLSCLYSLESTIAIIKLVTYIIYLFLYLSHLWPSAKTFNSSAKFDAVITDEQGWDDLMLTLIMSLETSTGSSETSKIAGLRRLDSRKEGSIAKLPLRIHTSRDIVEMPMKKRVIRMVLKTKGDCHI